MMEYHRVLYIHIYTYSLCIYIYVYLWGWNSLAVGMRHLISSSTSQHAKKKRNFVKFTFVYVLESLPIVYKLFTNKLLAFAFVQTSTGTSTIAEERHHHQHGEDPAEAKRWGRRMHRRHQKHVFLHMRHTYEIPWCTFYISGWSNFGLDLNV